MISLRKIALLLLVSLYFQRFHQNNEAVRGIEMLFEKIKNHVALLVHIRWLHSHLAKGMLLQDKRPRFASQKTVFCNALNIKLLHSIIKTEKKLHYIRQTADEKLDKC